MLFLSIRKPASRARTTSRKADGAWLSSSALSAGTRFLTRQQRALAAAPQLAAHQHTFGSPARAQSGKGWDSFSSLLRRPSSPAGRGTRNDRQRRTRDRERVALAHL